MRVLLERNLFLDGNEYRRSASGTEVPDELPVKQPDGEVMMKALKLRDPAWDDDTFRKHQKEDKDVLYLPRGAVLFEGQKAKPLPQELISNAGKSPQVALSELGGSKPKPPNLGGKPSPLNPKDD